MNRIFRWYYKNKLRFWIIVLAIVGVYLIILLLNNLSARSLKRKDEQSKKTSITGYTNNYSIKDKSSVLGSEVTDNSLKNANTIINKFIDYCNNGQTKEAYSLLTDECKELIYPSLEDFEKGYYNNIFKITQTYKMQNWYGDTYKIEYKDSILATGGKESSEYIRDYITVVKKEDETKLNINNYLGRTKIEKIKEVGRVKINVASKDTFMDYEIYNFEVDNESQKTIALDNLENSTSVFLTEDKGSGTHYFYLNELTPNDLIVKPQQIKKISIKFTNSYITDRIINSINFSNFIDNYDTKSTVSVKIDL